MKGSVEGANTDRSVAIFGAGVAGLSAAHELIRRGYRVSVYESSSEAGGFFRSARTTKDRNMPSEYSWHGMGPWYHNLFDIMKQIPFDDTGSVFDKALSRPIDFGVFPDRGAAEFFDGRPRSLLRMFGMSKVEFVRWAWLLLKVWTSGRRSERKYARLNAAMSWKLVLSERANQRWSASFGPWIGSDWTNASLHHAGHFVRKQFIGKSAHAHPADDQGPAWTHVTGDGWLLLRGPSSEYWFDKWVAHLAKSGVSFFWNEALHAFDTDGKKINKARLRSGTDVEAQAYILATNPFAAAQIVARTPALEQLEQLRCLKPLIEDGPHVQVSFRIAFSEPIAFPRERTAVVVADSEFNLTLFAEEQVWRREVSLGNDVRSLWTGTACVAGVPGKLYGLPVLRCTKAQFIEEVKAQIFRCESLDRLVREANGGRSLREFTVVRVEVWHEWEFSTEGLRSAQPKWVTTTHTQPYLPAQSTGMAELFLAGAHTKTDADVYSLEAAVESGRRAAKEIDPKVTVLSEYKPWWIRAIAAADNICFAMRGPHILELALGLSVSVLVALLAVLIA